MFPIYYISFSESLENLTTSLAILGRICVAGNFAVMFIYTTELYPTVVRYLSFTVIQTLKCCSSFSMSYNIVLRAW